MNLPQFHAFKIVCRNRRALFAEEIPLDQNFPTNPQFRTGLSVVFGMYADPNEIENRASLNAKIEKKLIQLEKDLEILLCSTKKGKFERKSLDCVLWSLNSLDMPAKSE
jgi:hypothetical protein